MDLIAILRANRAFVAAATLALGVLAGGAQADPAAASPVDAGSECADADLAPSAETLGRVGASMLCPIDAQRTQRALPGLVRSPRLDSSSAFQSADMVRYRFFAHEAAGHPTLLQRVLWSGYFAYSATGLYAENIGTAPRATATARALVNAWMASPDHRTNILDARLTEVGLGAPLAGADPAFYPDTPAAVYTTDFGRRQGALPAGGPCLRVRPIVPVAPVTPPRIDTARASRRVALARTEAVAGAEVVPSVVGPRQPLSRPSLGPAVNYAAPGPGPAGRSLAPWPAVPGRAPRARRRRRVGRRARPARAASEASARARGAGPLAM